MFDGIGMCSSDHDYLSQFINASRSSSSSSFLTSIPPLDDHIHCNPCFESPLSSSLENGITLIGGLEGLQGDEGERSVVPWSNEEVGELFRFRSSMESSTSSLPELISWGHVSRKLAEIGFKRSAVECKEKFEQGKDFNNVISYNKNSRQVCNEFDKFYLDDHPEEIQVPAANCDPIMERRDNPAVYHQDSTDKDVGKVSENNKEAINKTCQEEDDSDEQLARHKGNSKRKRKSGDLDTFKAYFEAIVDKVMAQQEELHEQLIASILERDKERIAREEAWKIQEMKRSKTAMETRAKNQANAEKRQATIIEFLKKFQDQQIDGDKNIIETGGGSAASKSLVVIPNLKTNPSAAGSAASISSSRWPREEVLALISMRCKASGGDSGGGKQGGRTATKGPLWERISQGMLELGYKRSAKRCKEKWENINKYFRKTKDGHKKRPVDARTCPYFHELSCLYSGRRRSVHRHEGEERQVQADN